MHNGARCRIVPAKPIPGIAGVGRVAVHISGTKSDEVHFVGREFLVEEPSE